MNKFIRTLLVGLVSTVAAIAPGHAVPVVFVYPDSPADAVDKGFKDPTLGPARKAAFEAAANKYGAALSGTVPLVISARFTPQGGTATSAVLANAGPTTVQADWESPAPPKAGTFYAIGLANQLAGRDLDPGGTDIEAYFNSDVDGPVVLGNRGFYYGTDGNSGANIDFYSVALHELGHGLGFLSLQLSDGSYFGSLPSAYDLYLKEGALKLSTATNTQRYDASISGALFFDGPFTNAGNNGSPAKIFAPAPYQGGSSVSHLDEDTFAGPNELMTPYSSGVAHRLGPVATGVFRDLGWTVADPVEPDQSGSTLVVNTTDDHDDSSCTASDCTLREAISLANYLPGTQTITFNVAAGNQQITLASSGLPVVTDALIVQGPTAQRITISGNNAYRVFYTGVSLALQNLSIINGSASGSIGAGLYAEISDGSQTISATNCTFSGNNAYQGAGIFVNSFGGSTSLNLTGSTLSANNAASDGGAILVFAGDASASVAVTMTGCTVGGNTAGDWGGGLFLWQNAGSITASLSNCTFSGNSATNYGGALVTYGGSSLGVDSVTVAGNSSSYGAAVGVFANSSFTSRNSLYAANNSSNGGDSIYNVAPSTSLGNNQFSDNPVGFTSAGDLKNRTTLAGTLGALANNGGPTQTRALLTGSPAINAGSTTLTADQRGIARPQGGAADVGAFEVAPSNTVPTISGITSKTTPEDTATSAIAFTIGDAETAPASLTLSAISSDITLVPNANITFGGSGANRTVTVTPAANLSGTATITITVSDGDLTASTNFVLTVTPVNDPPTISDITDKSTPQGVSTGAIAFTVGDIDSSVPALTLSRASTNTALVPVANIVFGGSGANRTVTVNPAAGLSGTATITVTVTDDGGATASDSFVLTVVAAPTITSFTPGAGPIGTNVVITGTGFTGATLVRFNGVASVFTLNSPTQITAAVPSGATTGTISVTAAGGTGTSLTPFTVATGDSTPPTVTVTTPAEGDVLR